jgi:hypothetical protein
MKVSIHQSAYLPWLGYIHKVLLSDVFVYFDTTQFEKNSFVNRNKIKGPNGNPWLTVPLLTKGYFEKSLAEMAIADRGIIKKHWKSIEQVYKKAPYWEEYSSKLKELYEKEYSKISELCLDQLKLICEFLEIDTKIVRASELPEFESKKEQLALDICKEVGATHYISGKMGRDYIDVGNFEKEGIKVTFQSYEHPKYSQLWGEFAPYMNVFDLIFNEGEKSKEIILSGNITKEDLKE